MQSHSADWKVGFGMAMRTYGMNDAHSPYEHMKDAMGENFQVENAKIESNGRIYQDTSPNFVATMRSLRVEIQNYREYDERMIKAQEE